MVPAGQPLAVAQDLSALQPESRSLGSPLCPALQMQFMLWLSVTQNELGPHTTLEQGSRQNFSFLLGMVWQTSL